MKKLYFYSKSKLRFVEISTVKIVIISTILSLLVYGTLFTVNFLTKENASNGFSDEKHASAMLEEIILKYKQLDKKLESLVEENNDLRLAANLPILSAKDRNLGIGGGSFNNQIDFLKLKTKGDFSAALDFVNSIQRKIDFELQNYSSIEKAFNENKNLYKCIPAIKPCEGTLSENSFGMRLHPILGYMKMHNGVDIITDIGTPVHVTGNGVVTYVGTRNGFGLIVEIDHGFGYKTIYGHLSSANVVEGQSLKRGDFIAYSGNSGLSSGPHLHYEVLHNGINLNPAEFLFDETNIFTKK